MKYRIPYRKAQTMFFLTGCIILAVCISIVSSWQTRRELTHFKEQLPQQVRKIVRQTLAEQPVVSTNVKLPIQQAAQKSNRLDDTIRKVVKDELESYIGGSNPQTVSIASVQKTVQEANKMHGEEQPLVYAVHTDDPDIEAGGNKEDTAPEHGPASAKKEKAIERTLVQRGGMLLPKGQLQVEPGITLAHFSSNRINIQGFSILPVLVIGDISVQTVKRDLFIPSVTFRYSPIHNLQTEINIPYRYEFDRMPDNAGAEETREAGGIGDIQITLSRQIAYESGIMPDLLAAISFKTITGEAPYNREIGLGTGHYGIRGALIAAKSSDPVVVFGNISYTCNLQNEYENYGKIKPGDSIGYALGAAIALSYQTAINFQYEQTVTFKMIKEGISVNGSFLNSASFKTGFTWSISDKCSIDFAVGVGLTTDAPDYTVEFRIPIRF